MIDLDDVRHIAIPAHPRQPAGQPAEIGFELFSDSAGHVFPVGFSTVGKLVAALGQAQPWIVLPARFYAELMSRSGYGPTYIDPPMSGGAGKWRRRSDVDIASVAAIAKALG